MTATDVRAKWLVRVAEWHREGTLLEADEHLALQVTFLNIDPGVYRVHWRTVIRLIAEEYAIRNGSLDDTEQFRRMDKYSRSHAVDQTADEVRALAFDEARLCVEVAQRHAAQKYVESAA